MLSKDNNQQVCHFLFKHLSHIDKRVNSLSCYSFLLQGYLYVNIFFLSIFLSTSIHSTLAICFHCLCSISKLNLLAITLHSFQYFDSVYSEQDMPRSRSASSSVSRRSRSPRSDRENSNERSNEYRVHVAELAPGVDVSEIRKLFQRFGTILDVWVASASCFAFVVFKHKEDAQKAIDQMDGRYDIYVNANDIG